MYDSEQGRQKQRRKWPVLVVLLVIIAGGITFFLFRDSEPTTPQEQVEARLSFDDSVTSAEQEKISQQIAAQNVQLQSPASASVAWTNDPEGKTVLDSYVPTTDVYAVSQNVSTLELVDELDTSALDQQLISPLNQLLSVISSVADIDPAQSGLVTGEKVALLNANSLSSEVKLLSLDGSYYLDDFTSGALYRVVSYSGEGAADLQVIQFAELDESQVYKTNITGVTALTREMQNKLAVVKDPLFFSEDIGDFLSDADLTHVSNEVSFKENCGYSRTLFCSPPEFIETLKASGVDLVELTGNHNNDLGSELNTATIEQYRELGWGTVGGGLNTEDAAKPFVSTQDGTTLGFLAYNFPDSPNGGAIAGESKAGANSFDFDRIEEEIAELKSQVDFVTVNVQYWECYAYPDGYVEFPECDKPIGEQEANFKKLVDLGADMVVGSSAHQPQTWEIYDGKPIYYGLGNMYFDQTQWPGTERGIVLSSYFVDGVYIQTKITPTVYNKDFQPRIMTPDESEFLLNRLNDAR